MRAGREWRPACVITGGLSGRPYRVVIYRYEGAGCRGSRTSNLQNKIVAGSRASQLLLDRAGQLESHSVLLYHPSHATVPPGASKSGSRAGSQKTPEVT